MAAQVQNVHVTHLDDIIAVRGRPKNPLAADVVEGGVVVLTGTDNQFDQAVNRQGTGDGSFSATQKLFLVRTPVTVDQSKGIFTSGRPNIELIQLIRHCRVRRVKGADWTAGGFLGMDADGNIVNTADANDVILGYAVDKVQGIIDIQPGRWAAPFLVV